MHSLKHESFEGEKQCRILGKMVYHENWTEEARIASEVFVLQTTFVLISVDLVDVILDSKVPWSSFN